MRPSFSFGPSDQLGSAFKWILGINVGVFILAKVFAQFEMFLYTEGALYPKSFKPWQSISYMFIHTQGMHLFGNMLGLFFFGNTAEHFFGTKSFWRYYFICGIGGALASYIFFIFVDQEVPVIGASGCVFGVLYAVYRFCPNQVVHLYFLFPIKIKYLLLGFGIFEFAMMFNTGSHVAHYAHLGGLIAGWAYFRFGDSIIYWTQSFKKKQQQRIEIQDARIKEQVDEILEKISREGMGALTEKEKNLLKQASKRYQKD